MAAVEARGRKGGRKSRAVVQNDDNEEVVNKEKEHASKQDAKIKDNSNENDEEGGDFRQASFNYSRDRRRQPRSGRKTRSRRRGGRDGGDFRASSYQSYSRDRRQPLRVRRPRKTRSRRRGGRDGGSRRRDQSYQSFDRDRRRRRRNKK